MVERVVVVVRASFSSSSSSSTRRSRTRRRVGFARGAREARGGGEAARRTTVAMGRGGKRAGDRYVEHELAGYAIEGVSVGGQETSIVVPRLGVAFDSGRCPQRCVYADVMCLSHTHMDHVGGCGMYIATRGLLSLEPPTVLLPRERAGAFATFIESLRALDDSELRHEAIGMVPGERYKMSKLFEIAPFKTTHPVPSQGYIVYGTKQKLKARYAGLDGKAIKQLRDEGEEVTDKIEVPQVAFTGDTTAAWVDDPANADALRAKLLIMECTFIDDSVNKEDAERFGHTHIDDIVARADKFAENEAILLIHFSARYKSEDVREALKAKLPKELYEKCTPMLVGYD
jgi:ribonuclease Z